MAENVLVVDDDVTLCAMMVHVLERAGYQVQKAPTGIHAQMLMRKTSFAALVTDLVMPDMDGLELIRKVRATDKTIGIVAMSSCGNTYNMNYLPSAEAFGANVVLKKPIAPPALLKAVRQVLSGDAPSS